MATCPAGHTSTAEDYCDVCGLPVTADAVAAPAQPVQTPQAAVCPNCGARNAADALFCEACGYDFTTGTLPRSAEPEPVTPPTFGGSAAASGWATQTGETTQTGEAGAAGGGVQAGDVWAPAADGPAQAGVPEPIAAPDPEPGTDLPQTPADAPAASASPEELPEPEQQAASPQPSPQPGPAPQAPAPTPPSRRPLQPRSTAVEWVAEAWIDPDWYATQGASDALPSPGLPEVVPLRASSALIGRMSVSRNIHPDIDCALDSGVSRRHAQVTTDGTRWWIEDLESSNGTFIGESAGQLPADPIGRGRVEFAPDQRIYVGAWTRVVIRRATDDEKQAYNPS